MNGNGGYRVAFWVMSVIAVIGLMGVINAVVANDRIRQSEDQRIEAEARTGRRELEKYFYSIDKRLGGIETKLGIKELKEAFNIEH